MRALLWIVGLFAAAAGLVIAARYNPGYVLMVLPPYRVELSLNLALFILLAGFACTYLLVRAVSAALQMPARVREYRIARRRKKAQATLLDALREYFSGRYSKAEKAGARSIELREHAGLGAIIAARAAHALHAYDRRDDYLGRAAALVAGDDSLRILTEAELLLDERRFREALDLLRSLPKKDVAALKLELKAENQARNWDRVLTLVEQMERGKGLDRDLAMQMRRAAICEKLKSHALDTGALEQAWQRVSSSDKLDGTVAAVAAQCFISVGDSKRACKIIENSLSREWASELLGLYAECGGTDTVRQIEHAEEWLKSHPEDAGLLRALGTLCAREGLWGKAQTYFEASISLEPTYAAHFALGALHERLGDTEAAQRHHRESLELAAARLKRTADDQRGSPL